MDAKLKEYPPIQEPGNLETSRLGLYFRYLMFASSKMVPIERFYNVLHINKVEFIKRRMLTIGFQGT